MFSPINTILKTFILFLVLCILTSCSKRDEKIVSLAETEYCFDERLSSVAIDADGICWVGTNTGDIINYSKNNERTSLGEDRIYKVLKASSSDSLYWVGVRNSGLQYWKIAPNESKRIRTFTIPCKGDRYSAYDFVECNSTLYVATSQGLYKKEEGCSADTLSLCYPEEAVLCEKSGFSYVINKLHCYNDSILLAATENELLYLDLATEKMKKLAPGHAFDYVVVYNHIINALSEGVLYQFSLDGDLISKLTIENDPKVYYQINGYHFFVSTDKILLSRDLDDFATLNLRREVSLAGRNVIVADSDSNFTYLLTEKALWRLPNHMDIFKESTPINLATTTGQNALFLSDKKDLFIQDYGSTLAEWRYHFSMKEPIKWMKAVDDEIYYTTMDNRLWRLSVTDSDLKNRLFVSPTMLYNAQAKITAFNIASVAGKHIVVLGVQDGVVKIHSDGVVDTIPELSDKYVTSIFNRRNSDAIYYATLNDGIYYESVDLPIKRFPKTDRTSFINDVIVTKGFDKTLIYLTNHQIITAYPADTIKAKGYNGLLYFNDSTFYALPEYGLHKLKLIDGRMVDQGLFYSDIRFDKWASFVYNNRIYLGSNLGVLVVDEGREGEVEWLTIEAPWVVNWTYVILILPLLMFLFVLWLYTKNRTRSIRDMNLKIVDLKCQLADLNQIVNYLDEEIRSYTGELFKQIESLDVVYKNRKESRLRLNILVEKVYRLSLDVALLLPQKLDEQIAEIVETNFYDRFGILQEIEEAKSTGNMDDLKKQLVKNGEWLSSVKGVTEILLKMKCELKGCVEIQNLTGGLYNELINLLDAIKKEPLTRLAFRIENLKQDYYRIFSKEGVAKIEVYTKELLADFGRDKIAEAFANSVILKITSSNLYTDEEAVLNLLKSLYILEKQRDCLVCLDELYHLIANYVDRRDQLILDNEKMVNRKFDADLESFIADEVQDIVEKVDNIIAGLYRIVEQTDQLILQDVLKLKNYEGQQAKVLAILLADPKVKRTYIPGILGIYGNLNPVISRLINGKIKANRTLLESYIEEKNLPSLFVTLILSLLS